MKKIVFIGSQGSGKTTSALMLASELKQKGEDVYVLSEVARSCPLPINEGTTAEAQFWIFGKQLTREQSCKANILISDRSLLDSYCYGLRAHPRFYNELGGFMREYMTTYSNIFYLRANDEYLKDDGIRSVNKEFRDEIDAIMMEQLKKLQIPFTIVNSGDIEAMMLKIYEEEE